MNSYDPDKEDTTSYKVVVNHEEQYSIWPEHKENPLGWKEVGKAGPKTECLNYIKQVWTDMRPLSLRNRMEEIAKNPPPSPLQPAPNNKWEKRLVDKLCEGYHPVEAGLRNGKTIKLFKEAVDRDYVHINFTKTKGGTELGVKLDRDSCDFSKADFENGRGAVHIVGGLTLDNVKVKCIADLDLVTLEGTGRLEKIEV